MATTQNGPGRATSHETAPITHMADQELATIIRAAAASKDVGSYTDTQDGLAGNLRALAGAVASPLVDSAAYTAEGGGGSVWEDWEGPHRHETPAIWTDLRPSEAMRLMELVREAVDQAARDAETVIIAAVVKAGLRFADEHPDVLAI